MADSSSQKWQATVLTLFPEMFSGALEYSIPGRAREANIWDLETVQIRDFATDKHRTVDDTPFGGGPGMVMRPDVIDAAIEAVADKPGPLLYMSPRGERFDQRIAQELAEEDGVKILCGRYEGIDQRVLDKHQIREVSLGDFVLSGGEPAAIAMLDSMVRLLPGALGADASLDEESFTSGLLEYPQYTRPGDWDGRKVPEVLLSGNHGKIRDWRLEQAKEITKERRPDLFSEYAGEAE